MEYGTNVGRMQVMEKKEERAKSFNSTIMQCPNCKPHEHQDNVYGSKVRIHTPRVKNQKLVGYRCTVCGTARGIG